VSGRMNRKDRSLRRWWRTAGSGRSRGAAAAAIAASLFLSALSAPAAEITIQNDSIPGGGAGTPLPAFITGEKIAVWLTAPVKGDLVAVQIDWRSTFGGSPGNIETAITVHTAGTYPVPGAVLATLSTPFLADVGINEFRNFDPAMSVPLKIPVAAGQTFVVALEIFNTQSGSPIEPSVVYDGDGCQAGLNAIFPQPSATWVDACPLGVLGDIAFRAVIDESVVPVPAADGSLRVVLAMLLLAIGIVVFRIRTLATV